MIVVLVDPWAPSNDKSSIFTLYISGEEEGRKKSGDKTTLHIYKMLVPVHQINLYMITNVAFWCCCCCCAVDDRPTFDGHLTLKLYSAFKYNYDFEMVAGLECTLERYRPFSAAKYMQNKNCVLERNGRRTCV